MVSEQRQHSGWITPYLPPVFHLRDFAKNSLQLEPQCRAYLNRMVVEGRLLKVRDDVYAKLGTHFCSLTFFNDGTFAWGKDAKHEDRVEWSIPTKGRVTA